MKCGICGATKFPPTPGWPDGRPMRERYDLNYHRRVAHPEAVLAATESRRAKAEAKVRQERDLQTTRNIAAVEATGDVLQRSLYSGSRNINIAPRLMGSYDFDAHYYETRRAEPVAFLEYTSLLEQAEAALQRAFELGTPVTEADYEQVRTAIAKVEE